MKKFSLKKTSQSFPICLDIGNGAVRALQLKPAGSSKFAIRAAIEHQYPQGVNNWPAKLAFVQDFAGSINKSSGFAGHVCRVSLPACFTDVVHLDNESSPADDAFGFDGPFDPLNMVIRQQDTVSRHPRTDNQGQKIVMAADRAAVIGTLKMLSKAGLDCQAVSMDVSSLMEYYLMALCRRAGDENQTVMFVDLGMSSAQVVVAHGPDMAFARNLAVDSSNLWVDRLAAELVNCLRYHDSMYAGQPITEAVFIGGRAYDRAACRQLAEAVSLPSRVGDPFALLDRTAINEPDISGPQWAVCMGLSLAEKTSMRKEAVA